MVTASSLAVPVDRARPDFRWVAHFAAQGVHEEVGFRSPSALRLVGKRPLRSGIALTVWICARSV